MLESYSCTQLLRQQPRLCQAWKEGKDCPGQRRQADKQAHSSCKTFLFSSLERAALCPAQDLAEVP